MYYLINYYNCYFGKLKTPILIHSMGKVGSLSVYFSLKKTLKTTPIFHTHSLSLNDVKSDISLCFDKGVYPGSRSPVFLINKYIISKQKHYKIITLFRDPIERNISAFFDAFKMYVGVSPDLYDGDLKTLENLFFEKLPHKYPLDWYDDYMLRDTGINVYAQDFEAEVGYKILKKDQKHMLLMNCYIDDSEKEKLIKEFCAVSNFNLINANVSANSNAADLYLQFKDFIQFPNDYVEDMYTSKYALHFFTENQRGEAVKKWSK